MASKSRSKRPFEQGDLVEGTISALSRRGGSIAEVKGARVRVMGGVPGDLAKIRVVHTGKNINVGHIHTLTSPSEHRVEAPCPVVTKCGGCPWQPASLSLQRETRAQEVARLLAPFTNPNTREHGWLGPDKVKGYRTRALMVTRHRGGSLRMGFYAPGTQDLVPIDQCVVQHPRVNSVLKKAHRLLARLNWPTWRSVERPGVLRGLLYRVDPNVDEGILTLILAVEPGPQVMEAAKALMGIEGVCGVHANINPHEGGPMLGKRSVHLRGKRYQRVTYGELELEVSATSFIQTRHDMAEAMVKSLGDFLPEEIEHLVDLYSGAGLLGLAHRHRAQRVTLVESHPQASQDAMRNADKVGSDSLHVLAEDAAIAAPRVLRDGADVIILDPPRAGCAQSVIDAICAIESDLKVLYVSCEARSLARDLKKLHAQGFKISEWALFDMFPHTPHVEVGIALERARA